jgi:hypothetical protein
MMVLSPINQELYDKVQVEIGYAKLFKHILEDFITRKDMMQILIPSNIPVTTNVNTFVAGTAGPYPVVGKGTGSGSGVANAAYKGETPSPGSIAMKTEKEAIVKAGGITTKQAIGG